ncbi:MAG: FAD:protein FMN transferase [Tenacibaculum sp.]|nr:FAD:protein FMN transferase [Tenacibaculum sp.]
MKKTLCIITIFITIFTACNSDKTKKLNILKGNIFGTYYIVKYDYSPIKNSEVQKGIDSIFNKINKSMNTYIVDSDISKINKGDTTVTIDDYFKDVFTLSKKINQKSEGYFDPTVGTLRNAYGFGDTKPINNISNTQLDSLMKYVGFNKVNISKKGKVIKLYPQIYLDFNAIAKGYAVDKIVEYLTSINIKNISVEIGGEVRVKGKNTIKNKVWSIGIESINSKVQNRKTRDIIQLKDKAIAGSGNFRKNRIDNVSGKKYVHTINPITGKAEQKNIISAYVIANTCAEADAYATTFMAMGVNKSKELLKSLKNIDAYLVFYDDKGNINTFITEGFNKTIVKKD